MEIMLTEAEFRLKPPSPVFRTTLSIPNYFLPLLAIPWSNPNGN